LVKAREADRLERLFAKACLIQQGKANGLWLPKMWHLALRRHLNGMEWLANWLSDHEGLGKASDGFSSFGLMRRAHFSGSSVAAQNLALDHFYRNDLAGYRSWLRRAAHRGDPDAGMELRKFETRQPFPLARKLRRLRPLRKSEKMP
jgi:hypothetical protein